MPTESFRVKGMRDDGDAQRVRHALGEVWGIRNYRVDSRSGMVTFEYDEKAGAGHDFRAAVLMSGFEIEGGTPSTVAEGSEEV